MARSRPGLTRLASLPDDRLVRGLDYYATTFELVTGRLGAQAPSWPVDAMTG